MKHAYTTCLHYFNLSLYRNLLVVIYFADHSFTFSSFIIKNEFVTWMEVTQTLPKKVSKTNSSANYYHMKLYTSTKPSCISSKTKTCPCFSSKKHCKCWKAYKLKTLAKKYFHHIRSYKKSQEHYHIINIKATYLLALINMAFSELFIII